jgi:molybdopterin-guanine dinucleotide biosynthesis protein B
MKLISVCGISKSGKTTVAEALIAGLKARGHTVGSIKEIHFKDFSMDTPGTNTFRHHAAGASTVCALGPAETDFLYYKVLPLSEILPRFDEEFVVMEGVYEGDFPKIIVGHTVEDILERIDENTVAVSGRAAALFPGGCNGLPAIDPLTEPEKLVDLAEKVCFEKLPGLTAKNCGACGFDCKAMTTKIIHGEAARADCKNKELISLTIGGKEIELVPFVQKALRNIIVGFSSELRGYEEGAPIEIRIG